MDSEKATTRAKLIINQNTLRPEVFPKIIAECDNSDYWHRFEVGVGYTKLTAQKIILDFLRPIPIEIVDYKTKKKKRAFFFAKNCLDAIMKIVSNQLQIPVPSKNTPPIKVGIVANFCYLNELIVTQPGEKRINKQFSKNLVNTKCASSSSFLINYNIFGPVLEERVIKECNNSNYLHKFLILNSGTYETDFILQTVTEFLHPFEPSNVIRKGPKLYFLASNCFPAIMKLLANKLFIPNPQSDDRTPFKVTIMANFTLSDDYSTLFVDNIKTVVQKRFSSQIKMVNLNEFHIDKDLKTQCHLSDPKLLAFVMRLLVDLEPKRVNLARNCINDITPINQLRTNSLKEIDLGHNQLSSFEQLEPLRGFRTLRLINLDGNPLCTGIEPRLYVRNLRKLFPGLKVIDGVNVENLCGYPRSKQNSLCSLEGGDLVEQFLQYFFIAYDRSDRSSELAGLYHEDAMFSMTYRSSLEEESDIAVRSKEHYTSINRDIRHPNFTPKTLFLFQGRENILSLYETFPLSCHDPYTIKIDLVYYTETCAVLVVHGIFREHPDQYFGFSRNFVLESTDVIKCHRRCYLREKLYLFLRRQYWELQETLHSITGLNFDYCRRYLEESQYDLEIALIKFAELHFKNQIPVQAFRQDRAKDMDKVKALENPHSQELVAKVVKSKGVFSKKTLYQMMTDEKFTLMVKQSVRQGQRDINCGSNSRKVNSSIRALPLMDTNKG
ncbi:hypothetical protein NQ315_007821 [Exocentrus adspersus]|uniref:Uncharacterized protein n=1 Tax=Exocentrus adspersus TaxID=1586481 RepID=A0AAV8W875_9CUCU|nr:hypothetical protein NQ315_007821 [Exocentrus adspersus]